MSAQMENEQRALITNLTQGLALASAVGAITSVLFNMIRFQRWGISFTDVATTSDIFMSGIAVGLALIKIAAVLTVGAALSEAVAIAAWRLLPAVLPRVASLHPRGPTLFVIAILTFTSAIFVLIEARKLLKITSTPLPIALVMALMCGALLNILVLSRHRLLVYRGWFLHAFFGITIALAAIIGVKLQVSVEEDNPLRWISNSNFCIGAPTVVWAGSSTVVARCNTSNTTFTYIALNRAAGALGRRRAVVRFVRDLRVEDFRPILNRVHSDWRTVRTIKATLYVDRTSIKFVKGEAHFVTAYFPVATYKPNDPWAGTAFDLSDQTVRCVFPYGDRLISLMAFSKSLARLRLNETEEDRRYDASVSPLRYELSQFVCEYGGVGERIDPQRRQLLEKIVRGAA